VLVCTKQHIDCLIVIQVRQCSDTRRCWWDDYDVARGSGRPARVQIMVKREGKVTGCHEPDATGNNNFTGHVMEFGEVGRTPDVVVTHIETKGADGIRSKPGTQNVEWLRILTIHITAFLIITSYIVDISLKLSIFTIDPSYMFN